MYRTILVPLDGSVESRAALPYAEALARRNGASLVLVRGVRPGGDAVATADLAAQVDGLRARGIAAEAVVLPGPPADAIVLVAAEQDPDLIVMSTHGRTGVQRWVLGSVADAVVRASAVPLLLLRPLLALARQPIPLPRGQRAPADTLAPTRLTLTGRQVDLVRLAFETLLWDTPREAHLTGEIQQVLGHLPIVSVAPPSDAVPAASPPPAARPAPYPAPQGDWVTIQPGYPVFAHGTRPGDVGQFVGVVDEVVTSQGMHYVHIRGGIGEARDLFLPINAVRVVIARQVHLGLTVPDLLGKTWHTPPTLTQEAS